MAAKRRRGPGPFSRQGLHRLECDCGAYVYATVSGLETHGIPQCECGARFTPERVELAMLLGLEDAPAVVEYQRVLSSVMRGQARVGRGNGTDYRPEPVALARVESERRALARQRRVSAILPTPEALPF